MTTEQKVVKQNYWNVLNNWSLPHVNHSLLEVNKVKDVDNCKKNTNCYRSSFILPKESSTHLTIEWRIHGCTHTNARRTEQLSPDCAISVTYKIPKQVIRINCSEQMNHSPFIIRLHKLFDCTVAYCLPNAVNVYYFVMKWCEANTNCNTTEFDDCRKLARVSCVCRSDAMLHYLLFSFCHSFGLQK